MQKKNFNSVQKIYNTQPKILRYFSANLNSFFKRKIDFDIFLTFLALKGLIC